MKDINALYVKALSSVIVPPGVAIGNAVGTSRFAYGFQVFSDLASGEDVILLANGDVVSADHAREERRAMFVDIVDEVYVKEAASDSGAPVLEPEFKIAESPAPEYNVLDTLIPTKEGYAPWGGQCEYTDEIYPEENVSVLYRCGETSAGKASEFRWTHLSPPGDYDIVGYRRVEATSLVDDPGPPSLPVESTGIVEWGDQEPVESAREDLDAVSQNCADEIHFGPITETAAEEAGFGRLNVWQPDERFAEYGRVAAFRFADGHVVVAKDAANFLDKYVKGASTFRPLKDSESVVQYTIYPADVTFNSPVPEGRGMPKGVDAIDRVRIFFVVGSPVYKSAFEVDWGFVGDPRNDVVAYQIVKKG